MNESVFIIVMAVGIIVVGMIGAMIACFVMEAIRYAILSALFVWISTADKYIKDHPYKFLRRLLWVLIAEPWRRMLVDHYVTERSYGGWVLNIAKGRIKYNCECGE